MTKCNRKILRGRSGRKWQNNIEMYVEVLGWSGLMCLRTRRKISFLYAQLFSRRTPIHGVGLVGLVD